MPGRWSATSENDEVQPGGERRHHQRFIAQRDGRYCFWIDMNGERYPLLDLSIQGFSVAPSLVPPVGTVIRFTLYRNEGTDRLSGRAEVKNQVWAAGKWQIGCLFRELSDAALAQLHTWLTSHVLTGASLPLTEEEAEEIVSGPSLI